MNDLFSSVDHPNHNPQDNDCICPGCMGVLDIIGKEMAEEIRLNNTFSRKGTQ